MLVSCPLYQDQFLQVFHYDNVEAVTLKCSPTWWEYQDLFVKDFAAYCSKRCIEYYLVAEKGKGGNLHFHGIMGFPFDNIRKRFLSWFNKYFGKYHKSEKDNAQGWYDYIHKAQQVEYLFHEKYHPSAH